MYVFLDVGGLTEPLQPGDPEHSSGDSNACRCRQSEKGEKCVSHFCLLFD